MEWYWWALIGAVSLPVVFGMFMRLVVWYGYKQLYRYKFKNGRLELLDRYKEGY